MTTSHSDRCYVEPLLSWAQASQSDQKVKREFLDPRHAFWPWLKSRVQSYYSVYYGPPVEFREECSMRLLLWAQNHVPDLALPEFTDGRLEAVLRTIAANLRKDTIRQRKLRRLESLDRMMEEWENRRGYFGASARLLPAGLYTPALQGREGEWLSPLLHEEFEHARYLIAHFGRWLRGRRKMRQLLAALLHLGRRLERRENAASPWFAYHVLILPEHRHLPDFAVDFLRRWFDPLPYDSVNARLRCLRAAFQRFSLCSL
jgi:hypothetical protein